MGVSCISVGSIFLLMWNSHINFIINESEFQIITFTIFQAFLSALISVFLAIPLAKAIFRNNFPGKVLLINVMNIIFILPVLVVVLTVIKIFGFNGLPNQILDLLGLQKISIYGIQGILLGHVLINLPFAVRLLLSGWSNIALEHFRLARQLNFGGKEYFKYLEKPMLKKIGPGIFSIIFLFCCLTFSIALILGGGPSATTIELAIYQAIMFNADIAGASRLAVYQLLLVVIILSLSFNISGKTVFENSLMLNKYSYLPNTKFRKIFDYVLIFLFSLFIFLPVLIIAYKGFINIFSLQLFFFIAVFNSVMVATLAVLVNLSTSSVLCFVVANEKGFRQTFLKNGSLSIICISPLVLGTAIFLALFEYIDLGANALLLTGFANGLLMVPISVTILLPGFIKVKNTYGNIIRSIGLSNSRQLITIYFPLIKSQIKFSFALIFALSIGDLGIIVLFAGGESSTLPMYLYRLMGSYRMDEAYAIALILLILTLTSFWLIEKGFYYGTLRKRMLYKKWQF